jgi:hypothetical protein
MTPQGQKRRADRTLRCNRPGIHSVNLLAKPLSAPPLAFQRMAGTNRTIEMDVMSVLRTRFELCKPETILFSEDAAYLYLLFPKKSRVSS